MSAVGVFLEFLVAAFRFLFNLVANLIALAIVLVCTALAFWRFPFAIKSIVKAETMLQFRKLCLSQALVSLYNFLGAVCFLLCMATWRNFALIARILKSDEWDENLLYYENRPKLMMMYLAYAVLDVLLVIPFLLLFFAPWRIVIFASQALTAFSKSANPWYETSVRQFLFQQLGYTLLDCGCYLLVAIIVLAFWRIPILIAHVMKNSRDKIHELIFTHAVCAIFDVPLLALIFFPWRWVIILNQCKDKFNTAKEEQSEEDQSLTCFDVNYWDPLFSNLGQGILSLIWFPVLVLPMVITPWRWFLVKSDAQEFIAKESPTPWYNLKWVYFFGDQFQRSVMDLGCALAMCIMILVPWRPVVLGKQLHTAASANNDVWYKGNYRHLFVKNFAYWCADVICILLFMILILIPWRLPILVHEMRRREETNRPIHLIIARNSVRGLIDIPALMLLVLPWRWPIMWYQGKEQLHQSGQSSPLSICFWPMLYTNIGYAVGDVITLLLCLPLLVAVWRWRITWLFTLTSKPSQVQWFHHSYRLTLIEQSYYVLVDILCAAVTVLLLVLPWRLVAFVLTVRNDPASYYTSAGFAANVLYFAVKNFWMGLGDIICAIPMALCYIAFWRNDELSESLSHAYFSSGCRPWYENTWIYWRVFFRGSWTSLGDILIIFPLLCLLSMSVYRLYLLHQHVLEAIATKKTLSPTDFRELVLSEVVELFIDIIMLIPCLIVGLTVVRIPYVIKKFPLCDGLWAKRQLLCEAALKAFIDLPCLVLLVLALLSVFRIRKIYQAMTSVNTSKEFWIACLKEFALSLRDTFAFLLLIVIMVPLGMYRAVHSVINIYSVVNKASPDGEEPTPTIEDVLAEMIFSQFFELVLDLLCLLPLLFVCMFLFRVPALCRSWKRESYRTTILQCAGNTILDIPCALAFMIVFGTIWRAYFVYTHVRDASTNKERWIACLYQLLRLVLDLPFIILCVVWLVPLLYRAIALVIHLKKLAATTGKDSIDMFWKECAIFSGYQLLELLSLVFFFVALVLGIHRAIEMFRRVGETPIRQLLQTKINALKSVEEVSTKLMDVIQEEEWVLERELRENNSLNSADIKAESVTVLTSAKQTFMDDDEGKEYVDVVTALETLIALCTVTTALAKQRLGVSNALKSPLNQQIRTSAPATITGARFHIQSNLVTLEKQRSQSPKKFSLTQFRQAAGHAFQNLLFDWLALICFTICLLSVYRAYYIITTVFFETPSGVSKRSRCVDGFLELFLDVGYLFEFLIVVLTLTNFIPMVLDFLVLLPRQPSLENARHIIWFHFTRITSSYAVILETFANCTTIKYFVATVVWGMFSPAVLLLETGAFENAPKFLVILSAIAMCVIVYGCPFIVVYKYPTDNGIYAFYALMGFALLASTILCGIFRDRKQGDNSMGRVKLIPVQCISLTWSNVLTSYGTIILQSIHVVAMLFPDTMFSNVLLLNLDVKQSYSLGFYIAAAIGVLHYVVASLPIALEDMLEWYKKGEVANWKAWVILTEVLSTTVYPFTMYNLCMPNALVLRDPNGWSNRASIVCSCLLMIFYAPTCLLKDRKRTESSTNVLPVYWDELVHMVIHGLMTVCVVGMALVGDSTRYRAYFAIASSLLCVAIFGGAFFRKMHVCSVVVIAWYKCGSMVFIAVSAIVVLLVTKTLQGYVLIGVTVLAVVLAAVLRYYARRHEASRSHLETSIGSCRAQMLDLEAALNDKQFLCPMWDKKFRKYWLVDMETLYPDQLAACLNVLEENVRLVITDPLFIRGREAWKAKLKRIIDPSVMIASGWIEQRVEAAKNAREFEFEVLPLAERALILEEQTQALKNSIRWDGTLEDSIDHYVQVTRCPAGHLLVAVRQAPPATTTWLCTNCSKSLLPTPKEDVMSCAHCSYNLCSVCAVGIKQEFSCKDAVVPITTRRRRTVQDAVDVVPAASKAPTSPIHPTTHEEDHLYEMRLRSAVIASHKNDSDPQCDEKENNNEMEDHIDSLP